MLVLDKFFSAIKTATDVTKTILTISGASPPTASLTSIEGTNKNIYDELQLVNNSVLYPCRVEYHTPYKFENMKMGEHYGFPFFVEGENGLELLLFVYTQTSYNWGGHCYKYDFSTKTLSSFTNIGLNFSLIYDIQFNINTSLYEFSCYPRRSSPPYDYYNIIFSYDTSFNFVSASDETDGFYYRGLNTFGQSGIEMFNWTLYFNLQLIGELWWLSLGHKVYVFDLEWNTQRIIFLNNSFLLGEEAENEPIIYSLAGMTFQSYVGYAKTTGCKSYIYGDEVFVSDVFGNIERYKI